MQAEQLSDGYCKLGAVAEAKTPAALFSNANQLTFYAKRTKANNPANRKHFSRSKRLSKKPEFQEIEKSGHIFRVKKMDIQFTAVALGDSLQDILGDSKKI